MARLKKKNNIKGFIDGKTHYTMDGKDYIKNSSAPDRERLKKDPAYASVRTNFNLFGSLSTIVSVFRNALKPMFQGAMNTRMHGNLLALFRSMVSNGERMINLRDHKALLRSYLFKQGVFFDVLAQYIPYEITCAEDRSEIRLSLKASNHKRLKKDGNRTHFKIRLGVLLFADCMRTEEIDCVTYIPVEDSMHGTLFVADSFYANMYVLKEEHIVLIPIPAEAQKEQISLVVFLHLVFYEEVNGVMYPYGQEAMKVADVF
jgi:hypothetical protein